MERTGYGPCFMLKPDRACIGTFRPIDTYNAGWTAPFIPGLICALFPTEHDHVPYLVGTR